MDARGRGVLRDLSGGLREHSLEGRRESRPRRETRVLQTGLRRRMRSVRSGLRSRSGPVRSGLRSRSGSVRTGESRMRSVRSGLQEALLPQKIPHAESSLLRSGLRSVRPGLRSRSGSVRSVRSGSVRSGVLMIVRSKFIGERRNFFKFGD